MKLVFTMIGAALGGLVGFVFSDHFGFALGVTLAIPVALFIGMGARQIGDLLDY